jgi:hypothetical protein
MEKSESLEIDCESDSVPLLSDSVQDDALSVSSETDKKLNTKKGGFSLAKVAISIGESRVAVNLAIFGLSIVLFIWRFSSSIKRLVSSKFKGSESRRARTKSGDIENNPARTNRSFFQSEAGNVSLKQRNRSPNSVAVVSFV